MSEMGHGTNPLSREGRELGGHRALGGVGEGLNVRA
jgi:hypothetical protein